MHESVRPHHPLTVEEYLGLEETATIKHEYVAGNVYAMTGATKRHNRFVGNIARELDEAADGTSCRVYMEAVKMRVASDVIYYPSVMVACEPDDDPLIENAPCLVVEATSPNTEMTDRREKLLAYTESGCILPSMSEKRNNSEEPESSRLEGLYRKASDPVLRTHLLMVWRMSLGESIREVAQTVGYSEKWTREIARRYESEGVEGLGDRRHANPGAKERALLDEEGQAELREALLAGPPPGGGMWNGPKVARWIEERTGTERVHAQRGWEYLRKAGMSPQVPRPSNAKGASASEREAFKKGSR